MLELVLVATLYAGPYIGQPAFCGGVYGDGVALPYQTYGIEWECGDLIYLSFGNGDALLARAVDSGPFGDNCVVIEGNCVPIAVDVPLNLWPMDGLSAPVSVTNITAMSRECHE